MSNQRIGFVLNNCASRKTSVIALATPSLGGQAVVLSTISFYDLARSV